MDVNAVQDKIQTGLRVPAARYKELVTISEEMGVSLNSLILMLVDLGLSLRSDRVTLHQKVR